MTRMADVEIFGQGFYSIAARTPRGTAFLSHVEGTEDGMTYCDDIRLTEDIARAALRDGLRVAVNGTRVRVARDGSVVKVKGGRS